MQPYRYLEQVASRLDEFQDRDQLELVLDDLELVFDAIDPEFQDLCSGLIERLSRRLEALP